MQRDEWRKLWQEEHRENLNQTLNQISELQVGLNTAETQTEQQLTVESR
jgi:hypothetical protein